MKKQNFVIIILVALGCLLASCGDSGNQNNSGATNPSSVKTTQGSSDSDDSVTTNETDDYEMLQLSTNIDSFQIQIQEHLYSFPMKYSDFIAKGWKLNEKYEAKAEKIGSGEHELVWFVNDTYSVNCYLYNPDVSEQPYENCVVSGVQIDVRFEGKGLTVYLPEGQKLGESKKEQIIAAYREADDVYESASMTKLTWETENIWAKVELIFDANGMIVGYRAENPVAPDDYEYSDPVVNDNTEYCPPEKLGASIEDRTVMFGGDLYSLPAPLSAFIDNGWKTTEVSETVRGNGVAHINLSRGEDEIRLAIWNYSEVACAANAAYVEKLSSVDAVAEGIDMSITEKELLAYLQAMNLMYAKTEGAFGNKYSIQLDGAKEVNFCVVSYNGDEVGYISISSSKK